MGDFFNGGNSISCLNDFICFLSSMPLYILGKLRLLHFIKKIAINPTIRFQFVNTQLLHLLLDTVLLEMPDISKVTLQILIKLFVSSQNVIYIPGKTLNDEKQRTYIMQHGFLLVMIHLTLTSDDELWKSAINEHIRVCWLVKELDFNLTMLNITLLNKNSFKNEQTEQLLPNISDVRKSDCKPTMIYTPSAYSSSKKKRDIITPSRTRYNEFLPVNYMDANQGYILSE